MGIVRTGESEMDKELKKWDTPKRLGGYNTDGFEPYPRMLYKAVKKDSGKVVCLEPAPNLAYFQKDADFLREEARIDASNRANQRIVGSSQEQEQARSQGWRETPALAIEYVEKLEQEMAQAAAEANYASQRMTQKARDERAALEAATDEHVPDVTPAVKKRVKETGA